MVKESTCKSNNKNNKRKQELANKKKKDKINNFPARATTKN